MCPVDNPDLVLQENGDSQSPTHSRPAECYSKQWTGKVPLTRFIKHVILFYSRNAIKQYSLLFYILYINVVGVAVNRSVRRVEDQDKQTSSDVTFGVY